MKLWRAINNVFWHVTHVWKLKENISSTVFKYGEVKSSSKLQNMDLKFVDPVSRQIGVSANAALLVVAWSAVK